MDNSVMTYLDLLDAQRETAYAALADLHPAQLWERPAPKEWCLGEILDHNTLLIASTLPLVRGAWRSGWRRAEKRRDRPYAVDCQDPYRKASFPHWVGFLWTPRHRPGRPVPLAQLLQESRDCHAAVCAFYADKDPDVLGNIYIYDPLLGLFNLIVTLRIGIYHDQLHFDDVFKLAAALKRQANPLNGKLACN